jgi:hypothetical protein
MYFNNISDLQSLRVEYKKLAFIHHPDISGYDSTEQMKQINAEYEKISGQLAALTNHEKSEIEFSDLYREKIEALLKIKGIVIELIGNWLWVTGETKENKEVLKSLDFKYAPKKKAWFFKNYRYFKTGKEKTFDEIKTMYFSQRVGSSRKNNETDNKLVLS